MTAVNGKQYGVGARRAVIYALNASGSPNATNTTAYTGVRVSGAKTFDLTIPEPTKITHVGDDRALQVDYLPPTEAMSGTLTVASDDLAVIATVSGTNAVTIGEAKAVGLATSEQGTEPQVALLLFQQSLDSSGTRNYRWFLFPKAILYPAPGGLSEKANEDKYTISPAVCTAYPWETAFADGTEGFTEAQALMGQSRYMPALCAWLASTATTSFDLPTSETCADTAKMSVFVDGVAQTSDITKATNQVQFTTAPGNAKRVVCFYEHS